MDQQKMQTQVAAAIEALFMNEAILFEYDASERTIAARLATYLLGVFPSHDVDVAYDRHGLDRQALGAPADCEDRGRSLTVPDIVVHRRGRDDANLLVIELRKTTSHEPRQCDEAKIRAMKRELGYRYGVLIDVPAGPGAATRKPNERWL
jgi:hypothetical protein